MKNLKKILCLSLTLALLIATSALLSGCNDKGGGQTTSDQPNNNHPVSESDTYTVTFVDSDGAPVTGVSVIITNSVNVFNTGVSDANGRFSIKTTGENLGVMIANVPNGYIMPEATSGAIHAVFGEEKNISITLEKKTVGTVTYKVKVVDQNGNAVVGASVQLCRDVCNTAPLTDANGETEIVLDADTWSAKIISLPGGYTMPDPINADGYHAEFSEGTTEITITVKKN